MGYKNLQDYKKLLRDKNSYNLHLLKLKKNMTQRVEHTFDVVPY